MSEAITTERQIPGYRNPIWLPRALGPGENVLVQQDMALIEQRIAPAAKTVIVAHLARLMNTCGTEQKLTAAEIESKLADYAQHLAEFSEDHLKSTISEWVRSEKWFPKIVELRDRLVRRKATAEVMRHRARVLLGLDEMTSWERSLVETAERERQQREMANAPPPDLSAKIGQLPPALAASVQGLMDGARKNTEHKQEAAE